MIDINLLPEELRKKRVTRIAMPEIPVKKTLMIAVGSLLALQILVTFLAVWVRAQNASYAQEIASLTESTRQATEFKKKSLILLGRLREFEELSNRPFHWAELLNALTQSVTKGVWLRSLRMEDVVVTDPAPPPPPETDKKAAKGQKASAKKPAAPKSHIVKYMKIDGSVVAPGQETAFVGKFLKSLKDNAEFTKVFGAAELSSMTQRKIQTYDVYDFVISCKFKQEMSK